jgi:methyl-accepting chemotaxis protein
MMSYIKNMSLMTKILGGFLLISCIAVIIGLNGFISISRTMKSIDELKEKELALVLLAKHLDILALTNRRFEKDIILNDSQPEKQKEYFAKFNEISRETFEVMERATRQVEGDPHIPKNIVVNLHNAAESYTRYVSGFTIIAELLIADQSVTQEEANNKMTPFKEDIYTFEESLKLLSHEAEIMIDTLSAQIVHDGGKTRVVNGLFVIIGVCLSVILGIFISRRITNPLVEAVAFAQRMAGGDFSATIETKQSDEIGQFVKALNTMALQLKGTISEVITGIDVLNQSSKELATISGHLTQGAQNASNKTNTVAAATEEMSVSMANVAAAMEQSATNTNMVATASEEMSSTIAEIARHAEKARSVSGNAAKKANAAAENINELGKSARAIGKVVETITDIAEQVNLLALNATIEAARAGEAGKGFAVVANEIKELAKQTATSTSDIKEKVNAIQGTTTRTIEQVSEINGVIGDVNEVVGSIATAVEEQNSATAEISNNVSQLAQGILEVNSNVSQSTTVSAEISKDIGEVSSISGEMFNSSSQVSTSAGELSHLAEQLSRMVEQFKVK